MKADAMGLSKMENCRNQTTSILMKRILPPKNNKQPCSLPLYPNIKYVEAFAEAQSLSILISNYQTLKKLKKLVKEPSAKCTVQSKSFLTAQ